MSDFWRWIFFFCLSSLGESKIQNPTQTLTFSEDEIALISCCYCCFKPLNWLSITVSALQRREQTPGGHESKEIVETKILTQSTVDMDWFFFFKAPKKPATWIPSPLTSITVFLPAYRHINSLHSFNFFPSSFSVHKSVMVNTPWRWSQSNSHVAARSDFTFPK